jgi:hypothetical protein
VAACAICTQIEFDVIGTFGFLKVTLMTIHASLPQGIKTQLSIRFMALIAVDRFMHAYQREGGLIVDFSDVFYDPRLCCMAACAVIPNGLIVHIAVAADTGRTCFLKVEIRMAGLAFDIFMLALQPKTCRFVAEFGFGVERPTA